jgi:hypothetical protein
MDGRRSHYDLRVGYGVTRRDDIDILDEGMEVDECYSSATDALWNLSDFVHDHGGLESWDQLDRHGLRSCWLDRDDETQVSYWAEMDRVEMAEDQHGHLREVARLQVPVTSRRVEGAGFGPVRGPAPLAEGCRLAWRGR